MQDLNFQRQWEKRGEKKKEKPILAFSIYKFEYLKIYYVRFCFTSIINAKVENEREQNQIPYLI